MKISDDYRAKVRLWAQQPTVVPLPKMPPLPPFKAQKFRTHEQMNQWERALLERLGKL